MNKGEIISKAAEAYCKGGKCLGEVLIQVYEESRNECIEKAQEWVFQNIGNYIEYIDGVAVFHNKKFKCDFKNAMEE